jgi:hypothetical protein
LDSLLHWATVEKKGSNKDSTESFKVGFKNNKRWILLAGALEHHRQAWNSIRKGTSPSDEDYYFEPGTYTLSGTVYCN